MKFYLRCDANQQIGYGHAMRCIGLADRLAGDGVPKENIILACAELPDEIAEKARNCTVVVSDDCEPIGPPGWFSVIDSYTVSDPSAFKMPDQYWFLRDELKTIKRGRDRVGCIGVSFGGGSTVDVEGSTVPKGVTVICPSFAEYADCLRQADVMLGAFGVSSWERCYLGIPTVGAVIAQNQVENASLQSEAMAALVVGTNDPEQMALGIRLLYRHRDFFRMMSAKAMELAPNDSYQDFWNVIKKGFS
jgi:hypothetical protein